MILAALLAAALGGSASAAWVESPRRILSLYREDHIPGRRPDLAFSLTHQRAELVLNHLGFVVEHLRADERLPEPSELAGVRGALIWAPTAAAFGDPRPLCRWLSAAMRAGVKVALVGELGLYSEGKPVYRLDPECAATLRTLGVEARGARPVDPLAIAKAWHDPRLLGFERRPDASETGELPLLRALPGAKAAVRVEFEDGSAGRTEPVVLSPRGGVALNPFFLYWNENVLPHRYGWVTDPFAFFESAFGARELPRPDPTTLSGRRLYMSRVDGDGFFNISELDRRTASGEVFLREFVERRPKSPFTISLIAGYFDLALYNDAATLTLLRRLMQRPNVEPASHGYAHPLVWAAGTLALKIPRYAYDAAREIAGSARLIEQKVLVRGARVGLFQWTGDCLPDEAALAAAEDAGLLQLNGGGGRYDRVYDSVAYLSPLSRPVGRRRQLYSPSSNENEFTNLWSGPFYGYRDAIETFERTGAPRRLKPVDVYVHFYSAERFASLQALRRVYDWAHAQPLIPVFGGRYARAARAFFEMKVLSAGPGRWRLEGGAALRTVRFDAQTRVPDLRASKGVLGYRRELGSLYVHLDESETREIVLGPPGETGPRLEQANFELLDWTRSKGGARFRKTGWWLPEAVLAGLAPGRSYRIESGGVFALAAADAGGRLALSFPDSERGGPPAWVAVEPAP